MSFWQLSKKHLSSFLKTFLSFCSLFLWSFLAVTASGTCFAKNVFILLPVEQISNKQMYLPSVFCFIIMCVGGRIDFVLYVYAVKCVYMWVVEFFYMTMHKKMAVLKWMFLVIDMTNDEKSFLVPIYATAVPIYLFQQKQHRQWHSAKMKCLNYCIF